MMHLIRLVVDPLGMLLELIQLVSAPESIAISGRIRSHNASTTATTATSVSKPGLMFQLKG